MKTASTLFPTNGDDLATVGKAGSRFGAVPLTYAGAAADLARIVSRRGDQEAVLATAQLELLLIARRDPPLAVQLDPVRGAWNDRSYLASLPSASS